MSSKAPSNCSFRPYQGKKEIFISCLVRERYTGSGDLVVFDNHALINDTYSSEKVMMMMMKIMITMKIKMLLMLMMIMMMVITRTSVVIVIIITYSH